MGALLNAANLKKSYATSFKYLPTPWRLRMELNPGDQKTKVVALERFMGLVQFIERLLEICFKRSRKWVKVCIQDGKQVRPILLNINSICARTLLFRSDLTSKSPVELSRFLAETANTSWKYKKLNEIFPNMTLINLDRRKDRIESLHTHLNIIGEGKLNYHRFSAVDAKKLPAAEIEQMSKSDYAKKTGIDDRPGRYGCYLSHLQALRKARDEKLPNILILEDDVRFAPDALTGPGLQKTLKELPSTWGILFLGLLDLDYKRSKDYSTHLFKPGYPVSLHAYVVNASMYDRLITTLENELKKPKGTTRAIDVVIAEEFAGPKHAHKDELFACKTNVAFQDDGISSILSGQDSQNYARDVKRYQDRFKLNAPKRTITADGLPVMPPKLAGTLYQMAYHLSQVFEKHNIRYWADGGTVLGMERHEGLIPHDDDIDLWVHPEDLPKLQSDEVKAALKVCNLELVDHWLGAKVCATNDHPLGASISMSGYRYRTPNIDIFFTKETQVDGEKAYTFSRPKAAYMWPNYSHKHTDVFDEEGKIKKAKFGPIMFNTLQKGLEYCFKFYGPNCMKEAYVQYDHIHERGLNKKPVQLTDFRPVEFESWDKLPPLPAAPVTDA